MKVSNKSNYTISDSILKFYPLKLSLSLKCPHDIKIYLEKNVQIIGEVSQIVKGGSNNLKHLFPSDIQPIQFRISSLKSSEYQIVLYQVQDDQKQNRYAIATYDFGSFLKQFEQEFRKLDERLQIELREKGNEELPQIWKDLAQNLSQNILERTAKFTNGKGSLEFKLVPFHKYDAMVISAEKTKNKAKEAAAKIGFWKSNTLPNIGRMGTAPKFPPSPTKKHRELSEITLVSPFQFQSPEKLEAKKSSGNVKEQLKKFSQDLQHKIKPETHHNQNKVKFSQPISEDPELIKQPDDQIDKLQRQSLQIDNLLETEELNEMSVHKHEEENTSLAQKNDEELKDQQRQLRTPVISRQRELISPEHNGPSRLGIMSLGSQDGHSKIEITPTSSKLKEFLVTGFTGLVFTFLIYFLMHPLAKTN